MFTGKCEEGRRYGCDTREDNEKYNKNGEEMDLLKPENIFLGGESACDSRGRFKALVYYHCRMEADAKKGRISSNIIEITMKNIVLLIYYRIIDCKKISDLKQMKNMLR